jgi:hypothetical protein
MTSGVFPLAEAMEMGMHHVPFNHERQGKAMLVYT